MMKSISNPLRASKEASLFESVMIIRDFEMGANVRKNAIFAKHDGKVSMRFGLSPIKEIIIPKEDGSFSARNTLVLDTFLVAAIGALRGVMMKNLKGTPLDAFYLPLIPAEHFRAKSK